MNTLFKLLESNNLPSDAWSLDLYPNGSTLFEAGTAAESFYLIKSGKIRSTLHITLEGDHHISPSFYDLGAGELIGELSLVDQLPYHVKAIAIEDSEIYSIKNSAFLHYMDDNPEQGYELTQEINQLMAKRARRCNEKVLTLLAWGLKAYKLDQHL